MSSGEQSAAGRTCLRAGEVDPAGQAQLCQDGKDITTATVTPTVTVTHTLPTVGSEGLFLPIVMALAVVYLCIKISRRRK